MKWIRRQGEPAKAGTTNAATEAGPCLRALVAIEAAGEGVSGEETVRDFARGYVAAYERICAAQGREMDGAARAVLCILDRTTAANEPAEAGTTNTEPAEAGTTNSEPAEAGTTNSMKGGRWV